MTTDSEAWELLLDELKRHGHVVHAVAAVRDAVVRERERQKRGDFESREERLRAAGFEEPTPTDRARGDFGALQEHEVMTPELAEVRRQLVQANYERENALAGKRVAERERDHAREELANERVRLAAVERERDEQRARAEAAEAAFEGAYGAAEARLVLLKEALGALNRALPCLRQLKVPGIAMSDPWGPPLDVIGAVNGALSKARVLGYIPDGEGTT